MTRDQFYHRLNDVDHSREKRQIYANLVLENPEFIAPLLEVLFKIKDKISCRAAWVLEYTCRENIELILPFLDEFIDKMNSVNLDCAVRPVAKIMECLAVRYYSSKSSALCETLQKKHIDAIVALSFDYLINDEKVAPKAHAMTTLYLFGQDLDWIHPELKTIIVRDYNSQSAAFKARGRHILKKLSKI